MADTPRLTQTPLISPWDFNPASTYGVGGFKRSTGIIDNDYIFELSDSIKLPAIWREMRESSPAIAAMIYSIESLASSIPWHVIPGRSGPENDEGKPTETPEDKAAAEFLESVIEDIDTPWRDLILDLLSMVTYGWAVNEVTYKTRNGKSDDPSQFSSKYSDGLIGIGKFTPISQVTRQGWIFVEEPLSSRYNEAVAIEQYAAPTWKKRHIPLSKCVHVTYKSYMGSPEGWSPLRAVYTTYRYSQKLQLLLAQGADRDLTGYPVVYIPEEIILGHMGGDPLASQVYSEYVSLATKTRRDDIEGLVLPSSVYLDPEGRPTGVPKYRFELMTTSGSRQFDLVRVLQMFNNLILETLASDIVSMGHEGVGSFALADVKNEAFKKGIEGILNRIQDALNTQLVAKLFELNPEFDSGARPKLAHGGIAEKDVTGIADYLVKLKQAGISVPLDKDMLAFLLNQASIPIPSEEALDHSLELSDQMAQTPQNSFQMSYEPAEKKKDKLLNELDVSEDVVDLLREYGAFEEAPPKNPKIG